MINALFPTLNAIDGGLAALLPLGVRVCLFGLLAGAAALGIYAAASNQDMIKRLKKETRSLRRKMMDSTIDPSSYGKLVKKNLGLSFGLLARVTGPTLLSALPVLVLATWLDVHYGYDLPDRGVLVKVSAAHAASIQSEPPAISSGQETSSAVLMVAQPLPDEMLTLSVAGKQVYQGNPFSPPIPAVAKRQWWNTLLENPAGYLAPDAPVDELHFDVAARSILPNLPSWAATWELPFFINVFFAALAIKFIFRIQ